MFAQHLRSSGPTKSFSCHQREFNSLIRCVLDSGGGRFVPPTVTGRTLDIRCYQSQGRPHRGQQGRGNDVCRFCHRLVHKPVRKKNASWSVQVKVGRRSQRSFSCFEGFSTDFNATYWMVLENYAQYLSSVSAESLNAGPFAASIFLVKLLRKKV